MKYSALIKEFNLGLTIKQGVISEEGNRSNNRLKLLGDYTGTVGEEGKPTIGIKPVAVVDEGHLSLDWEVSALRTHDKIIVSIPFNRMTADEITAAYAVRTLLEDVQASDKDLDETLNAVGFQQYVPEEEQ